MPPSVEVGGGAVLPLSPARTGVPAVTLLIGMFTSGTVPFGVVMVARPPERWSHMHCTKAWLDTSQIFTPDELSSQVQGLPSTHDPPCCGNVRSACPPEQLAHSMTNASVRMTTVMSRIASPLAFVTCVDFSTLA